MDCRNARARLRQERLGANGGKHLRSQWLALLARSPSCAECGRSWDEIPPRPDPRYRATWTKGHKMPVVAGGTDDISNIQAECYQCNFRKNAAVKAGGPQLVAART